VTALVTHLPFFVAIWVLACGLYGIITSKNLVHLVVCVAVLQSSTYVLLVLVGFREGGAAPVFYDLPLGTLVVDPIVQALMLTDVVVEATVMALLLAMVVRVYERTGVLDPDALLRLRG